MAITKLGLIPFLLVGVALMGGIVEAKVRTCPATCAIHNPKYMTCPRTGDVPLKPVCHCCRAPEGKCVIYSTDGKAHQCERRHRACPLVYIFADHMTCPYTFDENERFPSQDNCCFAPEGCSLRDKKGGIICTNDDTFVITDEVMVE